MRLIAAAVPVLLACAAPRAVPPTQIAAPVIAPNPEKARTLDALHAYRAGVNETETIAVVRAIVDKNLFVHDDDVGLALVKALRHVRFASRASGEVGLAIADALGVVRAPVTRGPLLDIVRAPNDGADTVTNKELTGRQAIAAQALGDVGDASVVGAMIDAMFEHASKVAVRKDPSSGDDMTVASSLTTAVSMILGGAIAKLGDVAVAPLFPYVRNDPVDPKVAAVRTKFAKYVSPGGADNPLAYVEIATMTLANVGTKRASHAVAELVIAPSLSSVERRNLVGLLLSLPLDAKGIEALKKAYDLCGAQAKTDVAATVSRAMRPELTEWLVTIADGASEDHRIAALSSALWLAPPAKLAAVEAGFAKGKLLERRDPAWRVMVPTTTPCNPTAKPEGTDVCEESPDNPSAHVLWRNETPTYGDEVGIARAHLEKCGEKGRCYLDAFVAAVRVVDKQAFTSITAEGTRAGIALQKTIWMLAAYGTEDDMIALVDAIPDIYTPAARAYAQMALSANLGDGSVRVADAITALIRRERAAGNDGANRTAAQFEPIANKLRARARKA